MFVSPSYKLREVRKANKDIVYNILRNETFHARWGDCQRASDPYHFGSLLPFVVGEWKSERFPRKDDDGLAHRSTAQSAKEDVRGP